MSQRLTATCRGSVRNAPVLGGRRTSSLPGTAVIDALTRTGTVFNVGASPVASYESILESRR